MRQRVVFVAGGHSPIAPRQLTSTGRKVYFWIGTRSGHLSPYITSTSGKHHFIVEYVKQTRGSVPSSDPMSSPNWITKYDTKPVTP